MKCGVPQRQIQETAYSAISKVERVPIKTDRESLSQDRGEMSAQTGKKENRKQLETTLACNG